MKKLLTLFMSTISLVAFSCWFTENNFNRNYIAGVNNFVKHFVPGNTLGYSQVFNLDEVDFPLTVWIKVSPRDGSSDSDASIYKPIIKAVLQYKVIKSSTPIQSSGVYTNWVGSEWVTVKTIEDPGKLNWTLDYENPVALFGRNNINPKNAKKGDYIMIRVLLSDGVYETGNISDSLDGASIVSNYEVGSGSPSLNYYSGGWTPSFVMVVKYSGNYRPII